MSLIPYVIPPLHGLRILITRPQPQAAQLAERVQACGGEPIVLPSIQIRPLTPTHEVTASRYQWLVFLSAHAVQHSRAYLPATSEPRIAAIGRATAAALAALSWEVHVVLQPLQTSEGLLAEVAFTAASGDRVLIIRGAGGRDALDEALTARGAQVDSLIVYERVPAVHAPETIAAIEQEWAHSGIDIVTATSAETLTHLAQSLSDQGRALLQRTPLAVVSPRVAQRARDLGLSGECIVTGNADDTAIIGALSNWAARAR